MALLLGCGAAAAVAGASFVDMGDPGAAALAQLTARANAEAELIESRWEERLRASEWIGGAGGVRLVTSARPLRAAERPGDAGGDRLRVLAALSEAARGDEARAQGILDELIEGAGAASGEALLTRVRLALGRGDGVAAARDHGADAEGVPWDAAHEGTSGRLLALLAVAEHLTPAARSEAADELSDRLAAGEVALPVPRDVVSLAADGAIELTPDPWWSELARAMAERLGGTPMAWEARMGIEERRARAVRALAPAASADRWSLSPHPPGPWIAVRGGAANGETGDRIQVLTAADLDRTLAGLGSSAGGLVASAFAPGPAPLTRTDPLEGTDRPLRVSHPDADRIVRAERRRLRWLRGGLLAVAALILGTTLIGARLLRRARALQELRSTFVASVSHDLRTPLSSIGLMTENLQAGVARGSEERYFASIRRETSRLTRLVDDLLDFGRLERGLLPRVNREPVRVEAWLRELGARERERCGAAGCALSLEIEGELGDESLDASALERAVGNLVGNAMAHGDATAVRIRARREGDEVLVVEVEDDGRGFPAGAVLEHLFEPFERRGEAGGTGLGLSIVRAIAEAHGGDAALERGAAGRGAIARLTLRTSSEESSAA